MRTAAVLLDQDQLANDLSDLSVSAEHHRRDEGRAPEDHTDDMGLTRDIAEETTEPALKASDLAMNVQMPWLSDGPAVQDHQQGPWLQPRDKVREVSDRGLEALRHTSASPERPEHVDNGAWSMEVQDPAAATSRGPKGVALSASWLEGASAAIVGRVPTPTRDELLAANLGEEPLLELGPAPSSNPLSGTVGRAQSADMDLLRRRGVGLHGIGGGIGGLGQGGHWRERAGLRHVSLELHRTSSPMALSTDHGGAYPRSVSEEVTRTSYPVLASSNSIRSKDGDVGDAIGSREDPLWARGVPYGGVNQGAQGGVVPPSGSPSQASMDVAGGIGAPQNHPAPSERQSRTPWWALTDSCPARLRTDSTQEGISMGQCVMNRPASLPNTQTAGTADTPGSSGQVESIARAACFDPRQDVSWSALHAMIPTPGMGTQSTPDAGLSSGSGETPGLAVGGGGDRTDVPVEAGQTGADGLDQSGEKVMDPSTSGGWRMLGLG